MQRRPKWLSDGESTVPKLEKSAERFTGSQVNVADQELEFGDSSEEPQLMEDEKCVIFSKSTPKILVPQEPNVLLTTVKGKEEP